MAAGRSPGIASGGDPRHPRGTRGGAGPQVAPMSVSVIDSSALLALLIGGLGADEVDRALAPGGARAPAVVDAETRSTLRWVLQHGRRDERRAHDARRVFRRASGEPVGPLLVGAWELRDNVSAFDALYVALARVLGAPLITADSRLATAPGLGVPVTLLRHERAGGRRLRVAATPIGFRPRRMTSARQVSGLATAQKMSVASSRRTSSAWGLARGGRRAVRLGRLVLRHCPASSTITLHCFQVASSHLAVDHVDAALSGIARSPSWRRPPRPGRREDLLGDLDLDRMQRPGAHAAEQEGGAELGPAAGSVSSMSP